MKVAKRFLSVLLSLCLVLGMIPSTALAVSSSFPFTDVNMTDWFYDSVQYVYDRGMMTGTSSTQFSPSSTTTRGMIVTVLHRMEGTPAASNTAFTDVPAGQWYSDAVAWASANDIVSGYGGGLFGPNDAITREQMATILYRYSQHKDYDVSTSNSVSVFSDAAEISSYATDAMGWAVGSELISGVGNNTLDPKGNATRAQIATILMRYCESIIPSDSPATDDTTTEVKTYTVTFDLNYGNNPAYNTQTVTEGKTVSKPSDPSRNGYDFIGWYAEKSGGNRFAFSGKITSDLILYAHWSTYNITPNDDDESDTVVTPPVTSETYTVTFESNGGSSVATQSVAAGRYALRPTDPIKSGYTFAGWFVDRALTSQYNFANTPVTRNLTLYAKWFGSDGKIIINPGNYADNVVNRTITGLVSRDITVSSISYELVSTYKQTSGELKLSTNGEFEIPVLLADGENVLTVTIETTDGVTIAASIVLAYRSGYTYDVDFTDNDYFARKELAVVPLYLDGANFNDKPGMYLVAGILNLYFTEESTNAERKAFIKDNIDGEPVGYINALDMVQVSLTTPLTADSMLVDAGLEAVINLIKSMENKYKNTILESVEPEFLYANIATSNSYEYESGPSLPSIDPWTDIDNADENIKLDNSWWIRAVDIDDAWQYSDYQNCDFFENGVKVGIVDSGIDTSHEDLREQGNSSTKLVVIGEHNIPTAHGTHVAGIIAAHANNGLGIAGILHNHGIVYGYDFKAGRQYVGDSRIRSGVTKLIENGAQIVNLSVGASDKTVPSGKDSCSSLVLQTSFMSGNGASKCIGKLLEKNFDFIVVQSAGNGNEDEWGVDYQYNGSFASINKSNCYSSKKVSKTEIMNHILIVSAIGRASSLTRFSNGGYGDLKIIAAPGEQIYSTIAGGVYSTLTGTNYKSLDGTSMAAPIVSAICGLVWSVNPSLSGDEVVEIVMRNTVGVAATSNHPWTYTTGGMGIVNALSAVEAAIDTLPIYSGEIVDANTGAPVLAEITIINDSTDQIVATCTSNASGVYTLPKLPGGLYTLKIEAEGYGYTSKIVKLTYSEHDLGRVRMVPFNHPIFAPSISGIVHDANTGTALDGVDVYVYDKDGVGPLFTGRTDSSGAFSITIDESGTYSLKFIKDGYADKDVTNINVAGEYNVGTVQLTPTTVVPGDQYVITGTVKDAETGDSLSDVLFAVYKENENNPVFIDWVDNDGMFSATLNESGTYRLWIRKNGYIDKEVLVPDVSGKVSVGVVTLDVAAAGNGTIGDPYQIRTPQQLNAVRQDFLDSYYYILVDDIDLSVYPNWEPISKFKGSLDGNGHVIKNLTITSADTTYAGLFGQVDAGILKNIILENVNIDLQYDSAEHTVCCGALAGSYSTSYDSELAGSITNCRASGKVSVSILQEGYSNVGGLIGSLHPVGQFVVSDCHNQCYTSSSNINSGGEYYGSTEVGGIIGYVRGEYDYRCSVTFENCSNSGELVGTTIGGIVGSGQDFLFDSTQLIFNQCFNSGKITGDRYAGGIVGHFYYSSYGGHMFYLTVNNSYNCGAVSGGYSSGIAGYSGGTTDIGGAYATIQNCYSIGDISAENYPAGILGLVNRGTRQITNCYYANADQGDQGVTESSVKLTLAEFQSQDNLSGFDFGSVWTYSGEYPYPQLKDNLQ